MHIAEALRPVPPTLKREQLRRKRGIGGTGANCCGGVSPRTRILGCLRRPIPPPCCGYGPGTCFGLRGDLLLLFSGASLGASWEGLLMLPGASSVASGGPLAGLLAVQAAILRGRSPGTTGGSPLGAPVGALLGAREAPPVSSGAVLGRYWGASGGLLGGVLAVCSGSGLACKSRASETC